MALVYMSGFEHRAWEPEWSNWYIAAPLFVTTPVRSGTYSVRYAQTTGVGRSLPGGLTLSEFYFQFATYFLSWPGTDYNYTNWLFKSGNNAVFTVHTAVGYAVSLYFGEYVTHIFTGNTLMWPDQWYVVEFHIKIHPTAGVFEIRLNGIPAGSFYGNTQYQSYTSISAFGLPGKSTGQHDSFVDDVVINDTTGSINNSWPGGLKIVRLAPTADGTSQQWTPTPAGLTHYTAIDEVPPSATDYLSTFNFGILDTFTHPSLPEDVIPTGHLIVQSDAWVMKDAAGSSGAISPSIKVGSTVYQGTPVAASTTYGLASSTWATNPAGTTWDITSINNLELGFQSSG
jgi:hypothetical protein